MKNGFSTLYIVIILGSITVSLVFMLSTSSYWNTRSTINLKNLNQAKALSNACAEVVLESMRENNNYTGSGSVVLDSNICAYTVINNGGNSRTIDIVTTVSGSMSKIQINTNQFNPLSIVSWQDVE